MALRAIRQTYLPQLLAGAITRIVGGYIGFALTRSPSEPVPAPPISPYSPWFSLQSICAAGPAPSPVSAIVLPIQPATWPSVVCFLVWPIEQRSSVGYIHELSHNEHPTQAIFGPFQFLLLLVIIILSFDLAHAPTIPMHHACEERPIKDGVPATSEFGKMQPPDVPAPIRRSRTDRPTARISSSRSNMPPPASRPPRGRTQSADNVSFYAKFPASVVERPAFATPILGTSSPQSLPSGSPGAYIPPHKRSGYASRKPLGDVANTGLGIRAVVVEKQPPKVVVPEPNGDKGFQWKHRHRRENSLPFPQ